MGARGVGAGKRRQAREKLASMPKRRPPWKKKGLDRAGRVIAFLEWLPITKGILAGQPFKLLPGQVSFIRDVYGRQKDDGRRLTSLAVKSEPKGNGKTAISAGLALCHLLGPEAEPRGEVYSAAIDRQQAGIMFAEMEAIIMAVPSFAAVVNVQRFHKRIEVLEGDGAGSIYEALSSDARRAHGLAPSLWVYDELAQARDRTLLDNLMEGMGKRREALGIVISTQAPNDDHPLSQLIDDGLKSSDPSVIVHLLAAPEDADPFDEEVLKSVNPAWGHHLDIDDLRRSMERARRMPAFEPAYRNLRLNQRVDTQVESRIVPPGVWKTGAAEVDAGELEGCLCFAGLDLSGKHDLTALVLVFPDDGDPPTFDILPFFWTPRDQLDSRRPSERDLFREWIRRGFLTEVPGNVVRYDYVAARLAELAVRYDIAAVAYDRWRIDDFRQDLEECGADVTLEPFGQGFKEMAPAIEYFAELALDGKLRHGGHPVLTANVASAITVADPAGNLKIDKGRSNGRASVRVDGAVALAMALGLSRRMGTVGRAGLDDFLAAPVMVV